MELWSRLFKSSAESKISAADQARAYFEQANLKLELGDAKGAIHFYQLALALKPDSASAQFNMGNAYFDLHDNQSAVQCYEHAISLKPDFTDAWVALGNTHECLGDSGNAINCYRTALKQKPEYAQVHHNLGDSLRVLKCFDEARSAYLEAWRIDASQIEMLYKLGAVEHDLFLNGNQNTELLKNAESYYRAFLTQRPGSADAHLGLAKVLHDDDRYEEAIAEFRQLIACAPQDAEHLMTLGLVLQSHEDLVEAANCYYKAIELNPALASAHNNLGAIAKNLGNYEQAFSHFKRAILEDPEYALTHYNLGLTLKKLSRYEDAEQCFLKAIQINPNFAEAYIDYGVLLQHFGKPVIAEDKFRRALELNPQLSAAYVNLGVVLCHTGRYSEADALYNKAMQIFPKDTGLIVNWSNAQKDMGNIEVSIELLRKAISIDPSLLGAYSNLLFNQHYLPEWNDFQMLEDAKSFGSASETLAKPYHAWENEKSPTKVLRIGFVSGDLRNHPVGFFLDGVMASITANASANVEMYAFTTRACTDNVSERLRSYCAGWYSAIELSDPEFCELIRRCQIDVLIDLSGHTGYSRLGMFAWRPSPVQVSWLGYFATTGLASIDYLIADPWTLPKTEEKNFVEKIWRLPETRLCFTPPSEDIAVSALPAIKNGYVTFSCFNNLAKVSDRVIQTWARILKDTPGSRLLVKSLLMRDQEKSKEIVARFAANGIAHEQLILEDYESRHNYFYAHHRVDIALDPFPYPGGTTTAESLWMGVPVLTLAGTHFLERQGLGLVANVGLENWIAFDVEDYISKAIHLASDIDSLSKLRAELRQKALNSPLFDGTRFAANLIAAFRQMWTEYCTKA